MRFFRKGKSLSSPLSACSWPAALCFLLPGCGKSGLAPNTSQEASSSGTFSHKMWEVFGGGNCHLGSPPSPSTGSEPGWPTLGDAREWEPGEHRLRTGCAALQSLAFTPVHQPTEPPDSQPASPVLLPRANNQPPFYSRVDPWCWKQGFMLDKNLTVLLC